MKKMLFKPALIAMVISTSVFTSFSYAALTPYESSTSKQVEGLEPIIPSIGTVIFKQKTGIPYEASKNNGVKTQPQVGDKLYVPVDVLESVKAQYPDAYSADIYTFLDWDGDIENARQMGYEVSWYVLDAEDTSTNLDGKTPVQTNVFSDRNGVPYELSPDDLGKKIAFRVTPLTTNGTPNKGQPLDVMDISKLAGQKYPEGPDGRPDPNLPPVIDETKPETEHPNIDAPIVNVGNERYDVAVYNAKGERVDNAAGAVPYINTTYHVVVRKLNEDKTGYVDVTEQDDIKNNIVWRMYNPALTGEQSLVVNTGIAEAAVGDEAELEALRKTPDFTVKFSPDGDAIETRLGEDTTTFTTQLKNINGLYQDAPNFSEQGLTLRAVLVADNGEEVESEVAP
ncbi:hypothetical protein [Thorsellia anophelis]|uniref:Uncharacterized protein n=1 Tax=Thorsellia anophelis DSM 18579 TaxID=1123402 RepID=A0A1I0C9E8_9GAMM|nr:hypothetical protein [Thorsellia anophelis]SET16085.1 hypothetical protein SAMN02583745_01531 [Thorsellia anophelis DSM 18579]